MDGNTYIFFEVSRLDYHQIGQGYLRCGVIPRQVRQENYVTNEYAVLCVLEGRGIYLNSEGQKYPFSKGNILQRFPKHKHSLIWLENGVTAYLALPGYIFDLIKVICDKEMYEYPVIYNYRNADKYYRECLKIREMLKSYSKREYLKIVNHIQTLFTDILIDQKNIKEEDNLVTAVNNLISDKKQKYSLSSLAKCFNMSNSSFRKKFSHQAGISPGKFIINKRLEEAKQLLLDNKISINEISEILGYSDIYTFSHQFKKFYGISPRQYRLNPE